MRYTIIHIALIVVLFSCATTKVVPITENHTPTVKSISSEYIDTSQIISDLYLRGAYEIRNKENYEAGRELLFGALRYNPDHGPSAFELASIPTINVDSAIMFAEKAVRSDDTNIWYRHMLAQLYSRGGKIDSAISEVKKTISLDNKNREIYIYLATLYSANKRPLAAINVIDSAMVLFGDDDEMAKYKLSLLSSSNLTDKAIEFAKDRLSHGGDELSYYLPLADLYLATGNDSLSLAYLNKSYTLDPKNIEVLSYMMWYYGRNNMQENWLKLLDEVINMDEFPLESKKEYIKLLLSQGVLYQNHLLLVNKAMLSYRYKYFDDTSVAKDYAQHLINIDKKEEALELFKQKIRAGVVEQSIFNNTIILEMLTERADSALHYYNIAVSKLPESFNLTMLGAQVYDKLNRPNSAAAIVESYLKKIDDDTLKSLSYGYIGGIYKKSNDTKKCYKYYEKALSYDKNNINVLNNYSYYLSLEGVNLEKALEMSSRVIESEPSNATYIDTYAWILFKLGRYTEAKKQILRAIALDSEQNIELIIHYGDILFKLGETTMAKFYWKKAKDRGMDQQEYDLRIKNCP